MRQAILSILTEAGAPLSAEMIKDRLTRVRGINQTYQIMAFDPVVKLPSGLWGINDRDAPITRAQQKEALESLVRILRVRGEGLHVSELGELGLPYISPEAAPFVFSCLEAEPRLRTTSSRYVYLAEWESARREGLGEAIRAILHGSSIALTLEKIRVSAEERIKRPVTNGAVSACLQAIGAAYDERFGGRWYLGDPSDQIDEDDEPSEISLAASTS